MLLTITAAEPDTATITPLQQRHGLPSAFHSTTPAVAAAPRCSRIKRARRTRGLAASRRCAGEPRAPDPDRAPASPRCYGVRRSSWSARWTPRWRCADTLAEAAVCAPPHHGAGACRRPTSCFWPITAGGICLRDNTVAGSEEQGRGTPPALAQAVAAVAADRHSRARAQRSSRRRMALDPLTVTDRCPRPSQDGDRRLRSYPHHREPFFDTLAEHDDVRVPALLPPQLGADAAPGARTDARARRAPRHRRLPRPTASARTHASRTAVAGRIDTRASRLLDRLGRRTVPSPTRPHRVPPARLLAARSASGRTTTGRRSTHSTSRRWCCSSPPPPPAIPRPRISSRPIGARVVAIRRDTRAAQQQ